MKKLLVLLIGMCALISCAGVDGDSSVTNMFGHIKYASSIGPGTYSLGDVEYTFASGGYCSMTTPEGIYQGTYIYNSFIGRMEIDVTLESSPAAGVAFTTRKQFSYDAVFTTDSGTRLYLNPAKRLDGGTGDIEGRFSSTVQTKTTLSKNPSEPGYPKITETQCTQLYTYNKDGSYTSVTTISGTTASNYTEQGTWVKNSNQSVTLTIDTPISFKESYIPGWVKLNNRWYLVNPNQAYIKRNSLFTVEYATNFCTSGSAPVSTKSYAAGQTVVVLSNSGDLARTGHIFLGWNTKADGSGITYAAGQTFVMGYANVILYPVWLAQPDEVRITSNQILYSITGGSPLFLMTVNCTPSGIVDQYKWTISSVGTYTTSSGSFFTNFFLSLGEYRIDIQLYKAGVLVGLTNYWYTNSLPPQKKLGVYSEEIPMGSGFANLPFTNDGAGSQLETITTDAGEGAHYLSITGTGSWMGFYVQSDTQDLSDYNHLHFKYKGINHFRIGMRSGTNEYWLSDTALESCGLALTDSWRTVKVPLFMFTNLDKSNVTTCFMLVEGSAEGYAVGHTHKVDGIYFSRH